MDNSVFRLLKNNFVTSAELAAVTNAFDRMVEVLAKKLGPEGELVQQIAHQLKEEVAAARCSGDSEFLDTFMGKGPMAQRLCDACVIDELLFGKHSAIKAHKAALVLRSFNYAPVQDPAVLHDMNSFLQRCFELLQPENLQITPYVPYPEMSLNKARTGFFWTQQSEDERGYALVLACTIPDTEVRLALFAATTHPVKLYVYHPQEHSWVQFDGTAVLPGMLESLEVELQRAYEALQSDYHNRNWLAEFEQASHKAWDIMHRSEVLPMQLRGFVRISEIDCQINVEEAGFKVMFQSTTGEYPNDTATILSQVSSDGRVAFTVQLKDLPMMTQCRIVSVVQLELEQLMVSLQQAEQLAYQDAIAP